MLLLDIIIVIVIVILDLKRKIFNQLNRLELKRGSKQQIKKESTSMSTSISRSTPSLPCTTLISIAPIQPHKDEANKKKDTAEAMRKNSAIAKKRAETAATIFAKMCTKRSCKNKVDVNKKKATIKKTTSLETSPPETIQETMVPSIETMPPQVEIVLPPVTTAERSDNNQEEKAVLIEIEETTSQRNLQSTEIFKPLQVLVQDGFSIGEIQDSISNNSKIQMVNEIRQLLDSTQLDKYNQFKIKRQQQQESFCLIEPLSSPSSSPMPPSSSTIEEEIDQINQEENDYAAKQEERDRVEIKMVATKQERNHKRAEIESIYKKIQDDIAVSRDILQSARVTESRATTNTQSLAGSSFKNQKLRLDKKFPSPSSLQFSSQFSLFSSSSFSSSNVPVPILPTKLFGYVRITKK